jgi:hypothetical protein
MPLLEFFVRKTRLQTSLVELVNGRISNAEIFTVHMLASVGRNSDGLAGKYTNRPIAIYLALGQPDAARQRFARCRLEQPPVCCGRLRHASDLAGWCGLDTALDGILRGLIRSDSQRQDVGCHRRAGADLDLAGWRNVDYPLLHDDQQSVSRHLERQRVCRRRRIRDDFDIAGWY